ncbi:MAG: hypothetical protein V3S46_09365 [Nitrospinota bacterium]
MAVNKVGGSGNQAMMTNRIKEGEQVKPPKKKRTGEEPIVKDNLSAAVQNGKPKPKVNVKA